MIVYADTSALVKIYIEEPGQDIVRRALKKASLGATSLLAYVELRSAITRAKRRGVLDDDAVVTLIERIERGWAELDHVPPDSTVARRAGELSLDIGLRAYDAVHLASADRLRANAGDMTVVFACFDEALNRAARLLGFQLLAE